MYNLFSGEIFNLEGDAGSTAPNTVANMQSDALANHSTYLYHTNTLAHGVIETVTTNTVATGLKLQSHINYEYLGITK